MKVRLGVILTLLLFGSLPVLAQRARRPARAAETGSVSVSRSATLRITIASDATGVFEYLSDSKKLAQWFPDQAIIEPQLGGKYHFRWTGTTGVWSGVVTDFIRGNTLGFTWKPPGEELETNVRFKLAPQGGQTVVELTHTGFTSSAALDKSVKAWAFYLENLKSVIEEGTDKRQEVRRTSPRRRR